MKRYTDGMEDQYGEWCRFSDVRRVIDLAADNSIKLELFHQALLDIATIPFSLPSGASGIAAAKKALDKGREIDDKAA